MPYAARTDLEDRFGSSEIAKLGATDGAVDAALADADAEIDAALATSWNLPLPDGPWPLLVGVAAALARARLYDQKPTPAVERARDDARDALARLAAGELQLVDGGGNAAPRAVPPQTQAADRAFGPAALEAF